jgi:hypothetical protein
LEQSDREPNRDRGALTDRAPDTERTTTDLRTLAHHRHPVVALGTGSAGIEPRTVVVQLEHDVLALFGDRHRHVGRVGVLDRVHDAFARDVEDEQSDRRGELDVLHIPVEPDVGITPDLVGERLERLGQTSGAEGRTVQVADQRTDPIRRLLLRFADLVELHADVIDIAFIQQFSGDIHLQR